MLRRHDNDNFSAVAHLRGLSCFASVSSAYDAIVSDEKLGEPYYLHDAMSALSHVTEAVERVVGDLLSDSAHGRALRAVAVRHGVAEAILLLPSVQAVTLTAITRIHGCSPRQDGARIVRETIREMLRPRIRSVH